MDTLWESLGVSPDIRAFFDLDVPEFEFGDGHIEWFQDGAHFVPLSKGLWSAMGSIVREVIITSSAMEAIAYCIFNLHRHPELQYMGFIALGNLPQQKQLDWIRRNYPNKKFILIFGGDILGGLADIRVAAGLCGHQVRFAMTGSGIEVLFRKRSYVLGTEGISLNLFEKATHFRTGSRTQKPKIHANYLTQLLSHAKN